MASNLLFPSSLLTIFRIYQSHLESSSISQQQVPAVSSGSHRIQFHFVCSYQELLLSVLAHGLNHFLTRAT
ncbi:unnamed protein product [Albugo candida]|uniref:Uncharacterized protein n=1 Tax=Albugo candida TaxID=65357 RepID=A0A024FTW4_9STRA|nr:unnamed protein product [Albugo candida]|eukprot:CCI10550.1 unnamed protein product [Albugo candida]